MGKFAWELVNADTRMGRWQIGKQNTPIYKECGYADRQMGEFALKCCGFKIAVIGYLFLNADTRMDESAIRQTKHTYI
ncbi:hypothetical protein [Flavobacterium sp. NKUCC04_CG]|uniref:hypothetical protein n=1 Tax=Flavobacterium sp. NKUCC04_CG TaxID=2842121 RepID=UPI001C5B9E08|nr:hypothetical protein [Flavobacterium sp. NKUCC04_CG]MBW3520490.1 hypothetical protein [Flavobacterium sp. NKUCC04_CG]